MRKWLSLLFVLSVLFILFGTISAQDQPAVFCGDLSDEDCELLQLASDTMSNLPAASFKIDMEFIVQGIPNVDDLTINLSGDGAYSADFEGVPNLIGTQGEEALAALLGLLRAFGGELNLVVTTSPEVAQLLQLPADEFAVELKLIEGIGYINFDSLDVLAQGELSARGLEGWGGLDLIEFMDQTARLDPTTLDSLDFRETGTTTTLDFEQYVEVERSDDYQGLAVFVTALDVGDLMGDEELQEILELTLSQQGQSRSQIQQSLAALELIGDNMTLEVVQYIAPDEGFVMSSQLLITFDASLLVRASGLEPDGPSEMTFTAEINYDNFNDVTLIAPPDANIGTLRDLQDIFRPSRDT
ncbi:MAG: hypothetical protein MUF87_18520 [Anaerolineae bacterium]|jgi:hypothetical protein|nr:hypothetical protein [Anaerolineae bacterium]